MPHLPARSIPNMNMEAERPAKLLRGLIVSADIETNRFHAPLPCEAKRA